MPGCLKATDAGVCNGFTGIGGAKFSLTLSCKGRLGQGFSVRVGKAFACTRGRILGCSRTTKLHPTLSRIKGDLGSV